MEQTRRPHGWMEMGGVLRVALAASWRGEGQLWVGQEETVQTALKGSDNARPGISRQTWTLLAPWSFKGLPRWR